MKVTPDLTTDSGSPLVKLADFLDDSAQGIKIERTGDLITVEQDSCAFPSTRTWWTPDDAEGIADLLRAKAAEVRELYGDSA